MREKENYHRRCVSGIVRDRNQILRDAFAALDKSKKGKKEERPPYWPLVVLGVLLLLYFLFLVRSV